MIEIEGLTYSYPGGGRAAVEGVSLAIADGSFTVVAGDSGGGKSTLVRAMCGLVPHHHGGTFAGTVLVGGRDTRSHPPRDLADVVGFVAQDPSAQAVVDRVEDELTFAMENLGVEPVLMRKRMEEVLDALALAPVRDRRLDDLSGGERQRVAIGSVLAAQPRCLILDEPTSQLDPQSAEEVLSLLHRLNADLGLTIVLVEHRLERVVQYADDLIVLRGGRIAARGSPRDVLAAGSVGTPLTSLANALGWRPLPLTIREGRAFAARTPRRRDPPPPRAAHPSAERLVATRGLRVARAGREVLAGVDLEIGGGELVALVGRNGSGKTTLLRSLLGLIRPLGGSRTIAGLDPARDALERIARSVAYVPQSPDVSLFNRTVRDEIAFTLRARDAAGDARAVVDAAGLGPYAEVDPRDLSAGERLRTAILAATAGNPSVVLLDEPTRGMDAAGKTWLARTLEDWRAEGKAVLLVTHDVELVARVATRVALLGGGRIVLDGPVREVLGESALFSSQMNKVFGDRRILTLEDALGVVAVP